jgi:hypothetical protein
LAESQGVLPLTRASRAINLGRGDLSQPAQLSVKQAWLCPGRWN